MPKGTPEAPASVNIRFSLTGYDCLFTIRGFEDDGTAGRNLLTKLPAVLEQLHKMGGQPIYGKNAKVTKTTAEPKEAKPETIDCPIHPGMHGTLKTGKDGAQWYSHKLDDGTWCNCKEKKE